MRTYLVTYDLMRPGKDYSALHDAIKSVANGWWHHLDSTWLVNSTLTAAQIRDHLGANVDSNDKLLVISLGRSWATHNMPANANAWLRDNLKPVPA